MHRSLLIRSLTFTLLLASAGCGEPERTSRKARAARPAIATSATPARSSAATAPPAMAPPHVSAPSAGPAVPPPAPRAVASTLPAAAPALALAGAGGAAAPSMAVLLLMLPAADLARADRGAAGAGRTYKLSLSANAELATIEVDGRPPVTTAVQRVYPAAEPPGKKAGTVARPTVAGPGAVATRPRPMSGAATFDARDAPLPLRESLAVPEPRVRASRRPATVMTSRTSALPPFDPLVFVSPNGAPIIE